MSTSNWITVTESQFHWELEALDFVQQLLPSRYPYRAWSNFEFIAGDGSVNEVDLLVLTPLGIFLITQHELGSTLIYEHIPICMRLEHFLAQSGERLAPEVRLDLLRQITDVIRFTHGKRLIH